MTVCPRSSSVSIDKSQLERLARILASYIHTASAHWAHGHGIAFIGTCLLFKKYSYLGRSGNCIFISLVSIDKSQLERLARILASTLPLALAAYQSHGIAFIGTCLLFKKHLYLGRSGNRIFISLSIQFPLLSKSSCTCILICICI